jgi:hypothetical protein
VSVKASHEGHVEETRHLDVADVAPAPGEKARILTPTDGDADGHRELTMG